MQLQEQIISAINTTLKNSNLSNNATVKYQKYFKKCKLVKKTRRVSPYLVVLHFVYMLVMNKKISTFINQSNDSLKKDTYYRLLQNSSYNWRKLLLTH